MSIFPLDSWHDSIEGADHNPPTKYCDAHSQINFVLSYMQLYCIEATAALAHYFGVFEKAVADCNTGLVAKQKNYLRKERRLYITQSVFFALCVNW